MIDIMFSAIQHHLRDIRSRKIVLAPGQYLFHLDDPIKALHLVEAGWVHLTRSRNDGSVLVLQKAGPGSIVAEASLYSEAYHCDATASGPAQLLAFAKTDVHQRLCDEPEFADSWTKHLAYELQRARVQAEILSMKTVANRLDAWIAWRGGAAPARGDWKTVAGEIGVSPEALYREAAKRRL